MSDWVEFIRFSGQLLLLLITIPGVIGLALLTFPAFSGRKADTAVAVIEDPRLAVVIPAHNEETGLHETISSLIDCNNPLLMEDVHVIADNCTDNTAQIAADLGCTVFERCNDELRGKGYALNYAFEKLKDKHYDGFVIVDADTHVESNFLDSFRNLFASGADGGQSGYRVGNAHEGLRPRLMHIAFLAFNYLRPLSRKQMGLSAGILGNGFGLSAATLKQVPYDSFSIVEDLEYHLRLIKAGRKIEFLSETTVWSDMPVSGKEAQSQRERWEGGRFRTTMDKVPGLFRAFLSKPKLKTLEPLLDLLLFPLSYHLVLLLLLLMIGQGWFAIYALIGCVLVAIHLVSAMVLGEASKEDWKALAFAPFYVLWKLMNFSKILKAAKKTTAWTRTSR